MIAFLVRLFGSLGKLMDAIAAARLRQSGADAATLDALKGQKDAREKAEKDRAGIESDAMRKPGSVLDDDGFRRD